MNYDEFDDSDKLRFAEALHEYDNNPLKAALDISDDMGTASRIAVEWVRDPLVLEELESIRQRAGDITKIASKYNLAKFYWDLANDPLIDAKDRISAAEHYGAVAGLYDPKATTNVTNTATVTRVMRVTDHGDDADWEDKLNKQQQELRDQANADLTASPDDEAVDEE